VTQAQALWEQLADELEAAEGAVSRSTMMGLPCLRLDGAFFASFDERHDELIVKLAADDVAARVAGGHGHAFAPAGKAFKEWLAIPPADLEAWRPILAAALAFAGMR
jgi:hypothetical protein